MRRLLFKIGLAAALFGGVFVAACGYGSGFIRDARSSQTIHYKMDVKALQFVRVVYGHASSYSLFCSIRLSGPLYKRAMEQLYARAALKPNQTIMNLREDSQFTSYLGIVCKTDLTVSGDVYQFYVRQ